MTYFHGNKYVVCFVVGMLVIVGGMFFTSYSSFRHLELKRMEKENRILKEKNDFLNEVEIKGINLK